MLLLTFIVSFNNHLVDSNAQLNEIIPVEIKSNTLFDVGAWEFNYDVLYLNEVEGGKEVHSRYGSTAKSIAYLGRML